jgi:hypothetical protein
MLKNKLTSNHLDFKFSLCSECFLLADSCLHHLRSWNRQSVPKRRHITFRHRRIAQRKQNPSNHLLERPKKRRIKQFWVASEWADSHRDEEVEEEEMQKTVCLCRELIVAWMVKTFLAICGNQRFSYCVHSTPVVDCIPRQFCLHPHILESSC